MRHERHLHVVNKVAEQTLFMIGDARDYLHASERKILALLEAVDKREVSRHEAEVQIILIYSAAHKDLNQWTKQFAADAEEAGFPYLHESLQKGKPIARVITLLPAAEL